jgi:hypothetical protein
MFGKRLQIVDLKCKVSKIGANLNRTARVKLADLNQLLTARRFKKDELRSTRRGMPLYLFKAKHVLVKMNRLLQIVDAVTSVKEASDHRKFSILDLQFSF